SACLQSPVDILRQLDVLRGIGRMPVVEADVESVQMLRPRCRDAGHQRLRRDAFRIGLEHDRGAMRVVRAHEMHGMSLHALNPDSRLPMAISEADVQARLRALVDPNTGRDFGSAKAVRRVAVEGNNVVVDLALAYPARSQHEALRKLIQNELAALPGIGKINVSIGNKIASHAVQRGVKLVPGVKNIIAVASGKGGVGKSTTAVNLALALAAEGAQVGVLDADIYGPSQPMMLGITGRPESKDGKTLEPLEAYGLQAMSIGFLIDI